MSDKMTRVMLVLERSQLAVSDAALAFVEEQEDEETRTLANGMPTSWPPRLSVAKYELLHDAVKAWRKAGEALYQVIKEET